MPVLYVVATPIGNLSDFSPRAIETLNSVALIAAEDTSHTIKLLNHFDIKTPMISYHKYNEAERTAVIINKMLAENTDVAIVTDAGTPCISDPGYDLIAAARKHDITVIGIPGACAAITALSISGFPSDSFAFFGFLSRDKGEQIKQLEKISALDIDTFIVYESPFRILNTLANIRDTIKCEVCVCNDISKLHEASISGDIAEITDRLMQNDNVEKGEYVLVIHKTESIASEEHGEELSIEAQLTDIMVKNQCTLKDAIGMLRKANAKLAKKDIYAASLLLKNMFE